MRSGNSQQAQLVSRSFHFLVKQDGMIGKKFEVILYFLAVKPGKGIEPLQNDHDLRQQDIDRVPSADMDLFMDQDLVIGLPVIDGWVDKNIITERTGGAVTAGLYDAVTSIPYDRA